MVDYKYVCLFAASWLTSFSVRADMNVAVIAPTDGDYKYYSEELINGAKVAVDEINENGGLKGKKVNLVQIDDPCDDTLSLTTAQMIAVNRSEEDKMHLVLGPQCINRTEKIAAVFSGAKIFQIHPTGSSRALYQTAHRGPVELVGYSEQQAVDFFRYYADNYADRKLAVVYDGSSPEMTGIAKEIQHHFTKAGLGEKLTAFSLEPFNGDARRIAQAVRAGGAEALFMMGGGEVTMQAVRYLKADDRNFVVFVNRCFSGSKFIRKMGEYADGIYILSLPSLSSNPDFAEDLVRLRLWGIEPDGLMAYGYLSVKMWEELVNRAGGFVYENLQKSLNKQLIRAGWGTVVYTDGEPDRSLKYAIYRFENGEYAQVY